MFKNEKKLKKLLIIILIVFISSIIFVYQIKKVGFHEDEGYTIASSVNPDNGLMSAYDDDNSPKWRTKEYVKDFMTLHTSNYLNLKSVYMNQSYDNHPPFFYTLVHFSAILFSGQFSTYTVFIVNITAFIISCIVIKKILSLLNKENLSISVLLFYGLSMGTVSMVIYQRMYMLLTLFILLYFYLNLKLYKNDFNFNRNLILQLGIVTVLGFLTQYFFAIYAFFVFIIMIFRMIKAKKIKITIKYICSHIVYGAIGVLIFIPCIRHLLFSDRGLSNLGNAGYFVHFCTYIKHLAYAFTVSTNLLVLIPVMLVFIMLLVFLYIKSSDKFIVLVVTLPCIFFFAITVKLTSFQELRYIMPIIPFVCLMFLFILDELIKVKYKNLIITAITVILVLNGMIFSKPKFLYENYSESLKIAQEYSDKSFVYVYDNFFNHMQSVPEMMIYEKTLIINYTRNELNYVINDETLNNDTSYILCIKAYMDNNTILEEIKNNSSFKNIIPLYISENSSDVVNNNLYLILK